MLMKVRHKNSFELEWFAVLVRKVLFTSNFEQHRDWRLRWLVKI